MSQPHRCPVCFGVGKVPASFYMGAIMAGVEDVPCRTCPDSKGVVWDNDPGNSRLTAALIDRGFCSEAGDDATLNKVADFAGEEPLKK